MTLGPKFEFSIVLPPKCFNRFVNQWSLAESAAFFAFYPSAVSKHDLKHSGTFFRKFACDLVFAAYQIFCPKGPCGTTFCKKNDFMIENEPFWDLKNSKCRASPVGIGSDTPSFWNLQSNLKKLELLQKPENLHTTLGPKFYTKLVSSITRRRKQVRRSYRCESLPNSNSRRFAPIAPP